MIKGDQVRPLLLRGQIVCKGFSMSKIIVDSNVEDKRNCVQVLSKGMENLFKEGYSSYIFEYFEINKEILEYLYERHATYMVSLNNVDTLCNYDVIQIDENSGVIHILYRNNSSDNALVITNKCNCNCIFCPESSGVRKATNFITLRYLNRLIDLIPDDCLSLCITGGEPTLLKDELFPIIKKCKDKFVNTEFLFLTNGRMFSNLKYTYEFVQSRPEQLVLGIAIHGHQPELHDYCTGVKNSFIQTFNGIKNLYRMNEKIELRIVVNKLNYKYLLNIAQMIVKYYPNIHRVSFMGLEMLGNAAVNRDEIWISFKNAGKAIKQPLLFLLKHGIHTQIYNFPLCFLEENLWQFAVQSISDYKVKYLKDCLKCDVKDHCGGFFGSTINLGKVEVMPL
ncbi:MAG: His-Xaa-Ser system radical SAM maturase HxsC [Halanaerobiales bacterium]|nr:His-Xaa-Ser system radical SAM maturase HxsC [Halanaerobiales bacterium]